MTLLFLNSLGTGEVVLIMFVVLILFGSKGIPDIAKNLGKGMREIRTASNEIKRDIQNSAVEMKKDLNLENPLKDIEKSTKFDSIKIPDLNIDLDDKKKSTEPEKSDKKA